MDKSEKRLARAFGEEAREERRRHGEEERRRRSEAIGEAFRRGGVFHALARLAEEREEQE